MDTVDKCRICIAEISERNSRYDLLQQPALALKFYACTELKVELHDELPSALCQSCHEHLEQFYEFRGKCIAADKRWRAQNQAPAPAVLFDDEKPVFDLDALQPAEPGQIELCAVETKAKKRRGRPPKLRKALPGQTQVEIDCLEANTPTDVSADTKDDGEQPSGKTLHSYQCDVCSARFFVEHRLVAHKRRHDGLVPYPCTQAGCERGFNRLHCLSEHLKQHAGTSSWYACEQDGCEKSYKHKPTLVMHMRKCHQLGPELKTHICEFCGKIFKSSAVLNDHRYTHKDKSELPHACQQPECARRFSTKEKLKVHMLRHAGIKNFSCPHCGMRKTTRNELKIHINYHTLERTWPCRFCSKVCNSAGNLKMHVRCVHVRAKDYACRYCERTFGKPDTRKYHEMTHTGERPNECQECGKRFTQPAALRTHRKIHQRQREGAAQAANAKAAGLELDIPAS